MSIKLANEDLLLTQLTDDYLNGRWPQLLSYKFMNDKLLSAFQARAYLMQGQQELAQQMLKQSQLNDHPWIKCNELICLSHIEFTSNRYDLALDLATQAQKIAPQELSYDVLFYRALALSELGEKYQALNLYSQIRKDLNATSYRKNLALINEAWILWDLGLIDPLSRISADLPYVYGSRIRLMLSMLKGDQEILHQLNSPIHLDLPSFEKENIFINLIEFCFVYGEKADLDRFSNSLFFEGIKHESNNPLIQSVMNLLEGKAVANRFEGRNQIDWLFLQALYFAKKDQQMAKEIYNSKLIPLMNHLEFYSPLIVNFERLNGFSNHWQIQLAQLVGPNKKLIESIVIINSQNKKLEFNRSSISLLSSPTTWKLVMALENTPVMSKEKIHAVLTTNRYRSDLHDTRIFKLIQRLNQKSRIAFGFEICRFDGTNSVELVCRLSRGCV